jgi:hypothetical protein
MGEHALYRGEQIKIGTCEDLYYLRAEQAAAVSALPNSLDPVANRDLVRFRFPFPDEDGIEPGGFDDYDRGLALDGLTAPAELAGDHLLVRFSAANGYLCSLPCPEGEPLEGVRFHKNGYGGAVELVQQRYIGDLLVPVLRCKGCGLKWALRTVDDAAPALTALAAMARREEQAAERDGTPGNSAIAAQYLDIIRRIRAGYAAGDSQGAAAAPGDREPASGSHDAASVVAQLAGLAAGAADESVTPEQLIERFCDPSLPGDLVAEAGTSEGPDGTVSRGHCGYVGGRGDAMVVGFDDGYDFMGYLGERGWEPLPAKGDWPYVVYLAHKARAPYAIAEYCEADLTIWTFKTGEDAQAFYKSLKDAP